MIHEIHMVDGIPMLDQDGDAPAPPESLESVLVALSELEQALLAAGADEAKEDANAKPV